MWTRAHLALVSTFVAFTTACAPPTLVQLPIQQASAASPAGEGPLVVSTRSDVSEPLRLRGSSVAYGGIERALSGAAREAALPWARQHFDSPAVRRAGFSLLVELTAAQAERRGPAVFVSLFLQATLRTQAGNEHLSQSLIYCEKEEVAESSAAVPLFQSCLRDLGREIGRWLGGVQL